MKFTNNDASQEIEGQNINFDLKVQNLLLKQLIKVFITLSICFSLCYKREINDLLIYIEYDEEATQINAQQFRTTFYFAVSLLVILTLGVSSLRTKRYVQIHQRKLYIMQFCLFQYVFTSILCLISTKDGLYEESRSQRYFYIIALGLIILLLLFIAYVAQKINFLSQMTASRFIASFIIFSYFFNSIFDMSNGGCPLVLYIFQATIIYGTYYFSQLNKSLLLSKQNKLHVDLENQDNIFYDKSISQFLVKGLPLVFLVFLSAFIIDIMRENHIFIIILVGSEYLLVAMFLETQIVSNLENDDGYLNIEQHKEIIQMIFYVDILVPFKNIIKSLRY